MQQISKEEKQSSSSSYQLPVGAELGPAQPQLVVLLATLNNILKDMLIKPDILILLFGIDHAQTSSSTVILVLIVLIAFLN